MKNPKSIKNADVAYRDLPMVSYNKIKRALASGFMHVLDEIRPENKMCLSNGECIDIEKAFDVQDWPKLERYLIKYSKPFEEHVEDWRKEAMAECHKDDAIAGTMEDYENSSNVQKAMEDLIQSKNE